MKKKLKTYFIALFIFTSFASIAQDKQSCDFSRVNEGESNSWAGYNVCFSGYAEFNSRNTSNIRDWNKLKTCNHFHGILRKNCPKTNKVGTCILNGSSIEKTVRFGNAIKYATVYRAYTITYYTPKFNKTTAKNFCVSAGGKKGIIAEWRVAK